MAKKSKSNLLGSWSFLVGVVLAVLLGLGFTGSWKTQMVWAVFLLGLVVGLLNVTSKEVSTFLTSGTILVLVSFLGADVLGAVQGYGVPQLVGILNGILTLFVPATIIVALKAVFVLAEN